LSIIGVNGINGATGPQGPQGSPGFSGALSTAHFFAIMPSDNAFVIASGTDVSFPQTGPTVGAGVTRITSTSFNLAVIGVYQVLFQISVNGTGQLLVTLNGFDLPYTVIGGSDITGEVLIQTTNVNSILTIRNPLGNAPLTVNANVGGLRPVSAHLIIARLL
jgi:hypothetical protein